MNTPPNWTIALVGLWTCLLIGTGLLCLLAPQLILADEGYRTVMRGVAAAFGMMMIAIGIQGLLAVVSRQIASLRNVLLVVGTWSLLLPTVMMTNLGAVEPIRMETGLNVFLLAGFAQFILGIPALIGAIQLGRIQREAIP